MAGIKVNLCTNIKQKQGAKQKEIKGGAQNFLNFGKMLQLQHNVSLRFESQDLDNNIPNFSRISATTTSRIILLAGIYARVTRKYLISPKHFTFMESKENKYL